MAGGGEGSRSCILRRESISFLLFRGAKSFGHRAFYVINFNWENAKNAREFCAAKLLTFTLNSLPRSLFELRSTPVFIPHQREKHPQGVLLLFCS